MSQANAISRILVTVKVRDLLLWAEFCAVFLVDKQWANKSCLCFCILQGKVHLELRLSEVITDSGVISHKLATR